MRQRTTNIFFWMSIVVMFLVELMITLLGAFFITLPMIMLEKILGAPAWLKEQMNDSGIYTDPDEWGEGPESAEELER